MKLVWQIIYPIAVYEILTAGIFLLFPDMQALPAQGISAAAALVILGVIYARGTADGRFYPGWPVLRLAAGRPDSRMAALPEKLMDGINAAIEKLTGGKTAAVRLSGSMAAGTATPEQQDDLNRFLIPRSPYARLFQCVCIGSVSCFLFNNLIAISGLQQMFTGYQDNLMRIYAPPLWQQIALAGVLIPAAEELVFRGMIYGTLRPRFSFPAAMIVSASIFGLYHGSVVQGIYGICMGLVLAESYEHRGGFWAAVTVHAAANLTAVFAEHFA